MWEPKGSKSLEAANDKMIVKCKSWFSKRALVKETLRLWNAFKFFCRGQKIIADPENMLPGANFWQATGFIAG